MGFHQNPDFSLFSKTEHFHRGSKKEKLIFFFLIKTRWQSSSNHCSETVSCVGPLGSERRAGAGIQDSKTLADAEPPYPFSDQLGIWTGLCLSKLLWYQTQNCLLYIIHSTGSESSFIVGFFELVLPHSTAKGELQRHCCCCLAPAALESPTGKPKGRRELNSC